MCQHYADRHQAPPEQLHLVTSLWPFYMWGVDILGPFPLAVDQVKFLLWIEVEPVVTISAKRVRRFHWRIIICRFRLPIITVSDNGTQFASQAVAEFCAQYGIKQSFTSMEHPQSNGQAEAANRIILRGLRKQLEEAKGKGIATGALIISHHTTLDYSRNPILPHFWNRCYHPSREKLRANLDLLQDEREMAHIREYAAKARIAKRYNSTIFSHPLQKGDLVLRRILKGAATKKLTPNWEGTFRVREEVGQGAFRLEQLDGRLVSRTWNIATLRKYYN
ncbi:Pro-Pol polyprotein, partial [Mucuna pruriens]